VALAVAGGLVGLAAVGGVGYVGLHGGGVTRAGSVATPSASPSPTTSETFGAKSGGSHFGSLSLLLLPMPEDYGPGPDVKQYGDHVELDAKKATAMIEGDVSGLSKQQRAALDASIGSLHIVGAGLRTYASGDDQLVVQMELVQMGNKTAARTAPEYFGAFIDELGGFRAGPKVAGYPQAVCVLPSADSGEDLDTMVCEATEGDLMVTMTVDGPAPLEQGTAADLLSKQLDRIKDPGEAV